MDGKARRVLMSAGLFAATILLGAILVWLSNGLSVGTCSDPARRDTCQAARSFALDRGLNIITAIGIALSAIGTVVLILTVALTARGTRAAVIAAEAATQAIDLARTSGIRELRPYLTSIGTWSMHRVDAADLKTIAEYYVDVRWQNVGQTPALNVRASANCAVVDGSLPPDFDYPSRGGSDVVGSTGRDQWFNSATQAISTADVDSVMRGEKQLHVWSWVEYEGFEPGVRYRSESHVRIVYWGGRSAQDPELKASIVLEDGFNGMDATCHRPPMTPSAVRLAEPSAAA